MSLTVAGVFCALVVLAMYAVPVLPFLRLELISQDIRAQLGRRTPINTNLVFLGLDQPGYNDLFGEDEIRETPLLGEMATYPLPRTVWAGVVERLIDAGAKVVALDFVFSGSKPEDETLRRAVQTYSNRVVLAANLADADSRDTDDVALLTPDSKILDDSNPRTDSRVGFINVWEDRDGVVRSARFQMTRESTGGMLPPGEVMHSFVARIAERMGASHRVPTDTAPRVIRFSAPPQRGYPMRPLYTIFLKSHWEQNYDSGRFFRGKVVVVGPAANIMQDFHLVPLAAVSRDQTTGEKVSNSNMPGPEIHLNILAATLAGELIREMSPQSGAVLTGAGTLVALILASVFRGPFRRLLVAVLCGFGFLIAAQLLFDRWNYVVYVVGPVATFAATTLVGFGYDFVSLRIEKNRTRRTLERYVSKDVVREVLDNPQTYLNTLGGVRKPVTILFSDVRGFTTLTEGADPAQLVLQLNEYFKEMVDIVFAHQGSLDKFIGDAVMALWGSITSQGIERDAQNAVAAALAMRKSLARLNVNWNQRGMKEFSFGIGINHGDAIVGNLGSEQKMEVSVIGDPVNLASRLEGLTKEYKLDLLLGEAMVSLIRERFVLRTVGSVQVKGKTQAARVFTVAADREAGEQAPAWLARYEQGIELYRSRKFAEGADAFAHCLREQPGDHLSQLYLDACRELMANPPGLDWDTVVIMKTK